MMRFRYCLIDEWPPLVWLACCRQDDRTVTVLHGPRVEVQEHWFCEGIWDGDFGDGKLDRTDLVFGSGGCIRDSQVTFVSSGATVDRLQSLERGDQVWVSNSLVCLLAVTEIPLDPTYPGYPEFFGSIVSGLVQYQRHLEAARGTIQLTYFHNLAWDGFTLHEVEKPTPPRDFGSFERYRSFLDRALGKILENAADPARRFPYGLLGTLSSGYDSSTVTALAREHGLREVISFSEARGGAADDGARIAEILGVDLTLIPRHSWRQSRLAEIPFLAADAKGEDVYFTGAESLLHGRVLLTGFHGDKMWGKQVPCLDSYIVRADQSGLSLTEYRLWAGFIHFPVPFMGVREIRKVNEISHAPEMRSWDVPGDYSRPICRRIVEEAGVPRELFGVSKKAASVLLGTGDSRLSERGQSDYRDWLRLHSDALAARRRVPTHLSGDLLARMYAPYRTGMRVARKIARSAPKSLRPRAAQLLSHLEGPEYRLNLFRYAYPWAVEQAKDRYRTLYVQQW
ncbi:MAG: hypothetical protein ACK47B_23035 [Armatimonadota bacterium]